MLRLLLYGMMIGLVAIGGMFARRIYMETARPAGTAQFFVGGLTLTVERAMVRNSDLSGGGAVNRLDLVLKWPDMSGAAGNFGVLEPRAMLFVTLEDATMLRQNRDDIDPAERPVELYARFLEAAAEPGPGGLLRRPFRDATPYAGEALYLSVPDERQFSARCPEPGASGPLAGDLCLWQTRIGNLELHSRFSREVLADWPVLAAAVRRLAAQVMHRSASGRP
jgi:hypothetical protein